MLTPTLFTVPTETSYVKFKKIKKKERKRERGTEAGAKGVAVVNSERVARGVDAEGVIRAHLDYMK